MKMLRDITFGMGIGSFVVWGILVFVVDHGDEGLLDGVSFLYWSLIVAFFWLNFFTRTENKLWNLLGAISITASAFLYLFSSGP